MQEIGDHLGLTKVTVFEHVEALIRKGALVREPNKARSLSIAEGIAVKLPGTLTLPLIREHVAEVVRPALRAAEANRDLAGARFEAGLVVESDRLSALLESARAESRITGVSVEWGRVERVLVLDNRRALSRRLLEAFLSSMQSGRSPLRLEVDDETQDRRNTAAATSPADVKPLRFAAPRHTRGRGMSARSDSNWDRGALALVVLGFGGATQKFIYFDF